MDGGFPYLGEWAKRLCKGCWIKTGCERQERSHLEGGLRGKESKAEGTWKFLSFRDDKKNYLSRALHAAEPEQSWSVMPSSHCVA